MRRRLCASVVVQEAVTVQGGYLRNVVVVTDLRRDRDRFVLLEHCDWVWKVATGKSRARSPLKEAKTLCRIRVAYTGVSCRPNYVSAMAEEPLAACENIEGDAMSTPSKRRRRLRLTLQELRFQIPAAESSA